MKTDLNNSENNPNSKTIPYNPFDTTKPVISRLDGHLASGFYEKLIDLIYEFEQGLKDNEEVGGRLVNFGQTITFHIQDIGYYNPSLIIFNGVNDQGDAVKLIQHVTQISILLVTLPRINDKERIGFKMKQELDNKK